MQILLKMVQKHVKMRSDGRSARKERPTDLMRMRYMMITLNYKSRHNNNNKLHFLW